MIHDLDNIKLSPRVYDAWLAYVPVGVMDLQNKFIELSANEIPDEQLRELPDGSAELFLQIRGVEIKMAVPANEWELIK